MTDKDKLKNTFNDVGVPYTEGDYYVYISDEEDADCSEFHKGAINMSKSGMFDKNGREILLGDNVVLNGEEYDVIINDFTGRISIDGESGHEALVNVHSNCEVVS